MFDVESISKLGVNLGLTKVKFTDGLSVNRLNNRVRIYADGASGFCAVDEHEILAELAIVLAARTISNHTLERLAKRVYDTIK